MAESRPIVHSDPEIMGGVPVFVGTRVPLTILFEYLANGLSLADFLDNYSSVRHEQALAAIEFSNKGLGSANPA